MEKGTNFVSPTGYVDLDNDCNYSIDLKSTRSRENVNPKDDLAFYFNTYITPKYGLENLNVSNVASFMKDLQMNWTILTPDLKDKVLNIMVDDIFTEPNFRNDFLTKLGVTTSSMPSSSSPLSSITMPSISSFGSTNYMIMIASAIFVTVLIYILFFYKKKVT
jgi:hypothetical protein